MKLVVGLGNPESQYSLSRHNLGWDSIDYIRTRMHLDQHDFDVDIYGNAWDYPERNVLFLKPTTGMNSSGQSVARVAKLYKINPEDILVIMDDMSLEWKQLRLRASGSHGSHNGLKSVLQEIQSKEVARLRIGIGKPPAGTTALDYVLNNSMSKDEIDFLETKYFEKIYEAVKTWIISDIQKAMTIVNSQDFMIKD